MKVLPTTWNAQLSMNPMVVKNAAIVHVFTGQFDTRNDTVLHATAKQLRADGALT